MPDRAIVPHAKYFVMLSLSNGNTTPMIDENDDPKLFDTEAEALHAAGRNPIGQAFHFEVYTWKR